MTTTIASVKNGQVNSIMVLNRTTSRHAQVIAKRTGSEEMGLMKSLLIDTLKAKLQAGTCRFFYKKLNGEIREAWGTTNPSLMANKIIGNGYSGEQTNTVKYWDVERGGFRCLRIENLMAVA